MRPRYGKLLSPERWNPQTKTFYEELVIVDETFVKKLNGYWAKPADQRLPRANSIYVANWGIGYYALTSAAKAFQESYQEMFTIILLLHWNLLQK